MSKKEDREDMMREQFEQSVHQGQLAEGGKTNAPETLKWVTKPEDIDAPVDSIGWFNNRSASTTNLSDEDIRSKEWIHEIYRRTSEFVHPPEYGQKGHLLAYVMDDADAYRLPLGMDDIIKIDGFTEIAKDSSHRSKEGWASEMATRDTKESIVRDENDNGGAGGLLGRFRG